MSVGARGELRDWEIFNRSATRQKTPYGFFSIAVKKGDKVDTRVLEARLQPPYAESHGFHPSTTAGLPRFAHSEMRGEYPYCWVSLWDDELPLTVTLEAYTPLIPHEPDDSGLPAATLTYTVKNTGAESVRGHHSRQPNKRRWLHRSRPVRRPKDPRIRSNVNELRNEQGLTGVYLWSKKYGQDNILHGSLALATTNKNTTNKPHWLRSGWWDPLREFWDDLQDARLAPQLHGPQRGWQN